MDEKQKPKRKSSNSPELCDSSDSDTDSLKIAIDEAPPPVKTTPKKRRSNEALEFDGSKLDKTIEETIEKCENFTPEAAKKMLLTLVKNEHILALSLLQAEDEISKEKTSDSEDEDKKSESESPTTPKLTRLKAKQLNQKLPIPGSLKTAPEPCEEVVALIQEELKSDEEDDEYQPGEEDEDDEDVTNTTFSDLESQPSTPGSALLYNEQDCESPVKDGEFKVPKSQSLSAEEQENISRRTRSKLCLTTTAIETIESTFIPPDITTDMYDFDQDNEIDNEWKEFLNEFMMPLTNAEEDDEKSDPEYVASEAAPMDKEELRPVRVSKKELNQLIAELLEDSCNSLSFDSEPSTSSKRDCPGSKTKRQRCSSPSTHLKSQSPKVSSRMYAPGELLQTPPPMNHEMTKDDQEMLNRWQEMQMQTPQRIGFETPTQNLSPAAFTMTSPVLPVLTPAPNLVVEPVSSSAVIPALVEPQKFPQITGVYGSHSAQPSAMPQILVMNAQNQLEIRPPSNLFAQAFSNDGIVQLPQFQSVVIQVPTIDLLQNTLNLSSIVQPVATVKTPERDKQVEKEADEEEVEGETRKKRKEALIKREKLKVFQYLETEEPPEEPRYDKDAGGFTPEQKEIYEQQMRIHAQILSQNFVQFYAHPKWWEKANPIKNKLEELKTVVKEEISPQTSKHIQNCLEMCSGWEKELEKNNERDKKYIEFLYSEMEFDERMFWKKKGFKGRFHNRVMEHMLSSKAILYPNLLPELPYRCCTLSKCEPPNSELTLLAIGIERFYKELYKLLNSHNPRKIREPKINRIATSIIREYNSFRQESPLIQILENYKNSKHMNPIKYYYLHKKAPAVKHVIEDVDLEKFLPPKKLRRGLLPKLWDKYMFSYERLRIYPYQPEEEVQATTVDLTSEPEVIEIEDSQEDSIEEISTPEILPLENQTISIDNNYKIEIVYDKIPKINICVIPKSPEKVSCISLLSPPKVQEEKQNNLVSILKKVSDNLEKSPSKKKSVNFLLPTPPKRTSVRLANALQDNFVLTQKFFIVIESFFDNYIKNLKFRNNADEIINQVYHWTKTIDIYLKLLQKSIMSKKKQNEASETGTKPKKNMTGEEYSKKLNRKLSDNRNLIMQNNRNKCTIEKDCSYAYNYLERVKKTLTENGDEDLYKELMTMLTTFNPDFESVPELYNKLENLLMPNYSDLLDLFLTFLLPEHAAEIGKFFEHFALSNMKTLLSKLNFFFNKQPSHMKKIYACLNEMCNDPDLNMEKLKSRIMPLLKGNQLLIDWFLELFEKPPESLASEFETVYIKKSLSDSDNSIDNYEEIHSKDLIECPNLDEMNACGVRYKNGKVMYHHGTLLPAKISFLAHDAPPLKSHEDSLCMHEIRKHLKFSDPKKPEDSEAVKKTPKRMMTRRHKLCDAQTLHAHAVRLNPVHARNGEKFSDLAHLLTPPPGQQENGDSPKKARNVKKSPRKKSPLQVSPEAVLPVSPSKALQIAKKLKNIVDENSEEPTKKKAKVAEEPKPSTSAKIMKKPQPAKKSPEEPKTSEENRGAGGWTRDEDKLILEQVKAGWKEELLDNLQTKLHPRTRKEIEERREYLLEILMMMKNVDLT